MWFKKAVPEAPAPAPERKYKAEDFFADWRSPQELPADAARIDVLSREIQALREKVSNLAVDMRDLQRSVESSEKGIDDWCRRHISHLAAAAAKQFAQQVDCEIVFGALQKPEVQQLIHTAVKAVFECEAKEFGKACVRAVLRQLGKGL